MDIGSRLKEERDRLGMNQTDFAALAGADRKTQFNYETGKHPPHAAYLAAVAAAGVDVLYVITGQRGGPMLRPDEAALLDNYRNSPEEKRAAIREVGAAFAQPPKRGRAVKKQAA